MTGDFNYDSPEGAPCRSAGGRGARRAPTCVSQPRAAMTEMHQAHPTMCEMANGLVLSRIDRIYVSALGWLLVALAARAWAHGDLVSLHKRCVSDHAPVIAQVMPRTRLPRSQRRLPHWVARTPEYEQRLKDGSLGATGAAKGDHPRSCGACRAHHQHGGWGRGLRACEG